MKKKLFYSTLLLSTALLLSGCTDDNGNDLGAKRLLVKANDNFKEATSYLETTYETTRIDSQYIQTEVEFRQPNVTNEEDGSYVTGYQDKFLVAFPYAVKNKADLKADMPTKIGDETGKGYQEYFITEKGGEPTLYSENEEEQEEVVLKKDDVYALLSLAAKTENNEEVNLYGYTGSDFHVKTFIERVKNLEKKETVTVDGREVVILTGEIKGKKDETFLIFEDATVEFWIDKEEKQIVKEVYRNNKEKDKEAGTGEVIFQYSHFNEDLKLKEKATVTQKIDQFIKWIDLDEKATKVQEKTRAKYNNVDSATKEKEEKKVEDKENEEETDKE